MSSACSSKSKTDMSYQKAEAKNPTVAINKLFVHIISPSNIRASHRFAMLYADRFYVVDVCVFFVFVIWFFVCMFFKFFDIVNCVRFVIEPLCLILLNIGAFFFIYFLKHYDHETDTSIGIRIVILNRICKILH